MENESHIILRLRAEARKHETAALERAEKAKRDAERYAVEVAAYDKAIKAMQIAKVEGLDLDSGLGPAANQPSKTGASDKWISIYRALHDGASQPYTYEDLDAAVSMAGHEASSGGQRTQMMNAVKARWFTRVANGKFKITDSGLELIGVSQKENEPPMGGSETGEAATSSDQVEGASSGLPLTNFPDPTGPTRHG